MFQFSRRNLLILLAFPLLTACGNSGRSRTATSVITPTSTATAIPTPTVTLAPTVAPTVTPTIMPTATSTPTNVPTFTPTPIPYASGGLGLSKTDWEKRYGPSTARSEYYALTSPSGNIKNIRASWNDAQAISLDAARNRAKGLLPADAVYVRAYDIRDQVNWTTVEVFLSESLAARFPGENTIWTGDKSSTTSQPGTCSAWYDIVPNGSRYAGKISQITISTGLLS